MKMHGTAGSRSFRLVLLLALVLAGLGASLGTPALASPKKVTAITEMPSKVSSLRRDAAGKPLSAAERKAEGAIKDSTTPPPGNTNGMGTPADKTLLESDQVLRETNTFTTSGTNSTTISAYGMKADMSAISGTPTESPLSHRSLIDQQYHSAGGHFLDAVDMGALDFKLQQAGDDGVLSLTSPNQAVENSWPLSQTVTLPDPGTTYAFVQGTGANRTALTNSEIAGSKALGTQARSEPLVSGTPDPSQLWAVVDAGYNDGSFSLVSRADGLCLAWSGQFVSIDTCIDAVSRHWKYNNDPNNNAWIFPASEDSQSSLGSDGGYGVAKTLGANTQQTWSALPLQERAGSLPSWSTVIGGANTSGHRNIPYDFAVGDLDGVVTQDPLAGGPLPDGSNAPGGLAFHDEAVVAWRDPASATLQVRVIDYNANANHLLVTAPGEALTLPKGTVGSADATLVGDVVVGVGDFNGDGQNEIAVGYQDSSFDFTFNFYSYVKNSNGSRSLISPKSCGTPCGGQPFVSTTNISGETGYADLAVGDFDGDGRDDLALGYASWASASNQTDHDAHLGVWTLNPDLSTRSVEVTDLPTDKGTLPRTLNGDDTRTQSGIALVAGNLNSDPDNGFGPMRSEIAMAYTVYDVGSQQFGQRKYTVTPSVNIYAVTTTCNDLGSACSSTTTPTNGKDEPTALFPSHPTKVTPRNEGTHFDPAPISLAAGGFGGQAATDPPVDGLLASTSTEDFGSQTWTWYLQESIVVPWSTTDQTSTTWAPDDGNTETKTGSVANVSAPPDTIPWHLRHYTAYDSLGQSLVLGSPNVMTIENEIKPSIIAAEPPTQVDWVGTDSSGNPIWINISKTNPPPYLETQTTSGTTLSSSTTVQNGKTQTAKQGAGVSVSWGENAYYGPSETGNVSINQHFSRTWAGLNTNSSQVTGAFGSTADAQTNQDDSITYKTENYQIWRYPILGTVGQTSDSNGCTSPCRAYYNVVLPSSYVDFPNAAGKQTSLFQPSWSNLNALSYPAVNSLQSNPVPTPDLGSYSYLQGKDAVPVTAPLYNKVNTMSNNNGVIDLDFSTSQGSSTTRETSRTTDVGVDFALSYTVGFGGAAEGDNYVNVGGTVSAGYDQTNTLDSTSIGTTTNSSDQKFTMNYPGVSEDQGYNVATAYYYANDGSAKVVHGVDLTATQLGAQWWKDTYGQQADPALNLPNRIQLDQDSNNVYDVPKWMTFADRQLIRGFQVLQTDDDGSGLPTAGMPFTQNPLATKRVTFQVPVHNYSLKAMDNPIQLKWTAVPIDSGTGEVSNASPIDLGTSSVPALGPQGTKLVASQPWTAQAGPDGSAQTYRIFVQLDPSGAAASDDLHPLDGSACPASSLQPNANTKITPALDDLMKPGSVADPVGCGQDNQGFGLVTVGAAPGLRGDRHATPGEPARAILAGGGLIDGDADHLHLTTSSAVPTIVAGQPVTGVVRASASLQLNDRPLIAVFDGPPSDHKLIALTTMAGIDDQLGGATTFNWTPETPGVHELHQVMLGTQSSGDDDEQIMRVNVEALDQYTVKAAASSSSVPVGGAFSISGTVTPVPDGDFARTVQLQHRNGADWTVVDSQQTSSTGRFDFDVTGAKSGSSTYRVLKLATSGRHEKASDPITVVVGGFVVTAKAASGSVDLGKPVIVTGTALPVQQTSADRTVDLQLKSGSTWKTVATGATTASGAYTLTTKPTKEGTYDYRVTKRATATLPAASSPTLSVRVVQQFTVTAKASPTTIKLGKKTAVTGKVSPPMARAADRGIELQVRSGSTWKRVQRASTTASGSYSFSVKPAKKGTYGYRVVKLAAAGKRTAYSPVVTVTVKR